MILGFLTIVKNCQASSKFEAVKSHGFSRVAAGTWGIFSSYDEDAYSQREFV